MKVKLKPAEVRDRIKRLVEQAKLRVLITETWIKRGDENYRNEKVAEQQAIIDEAQAKINVIENEYLTADDEIKSLKHNQDYDNKILVKLVNHVKIERIKKLAEQIRKETQDVNANSNKKE
jgi:hypothetical protein